MIDYDEEWPLATILRWRGSVIPRALLYVVPAPLLAAMVILCEDTYPETMVQFRLQDVSVGHMYTASTASLMLLIAFRTSQALARYWEGTSLLHQMQGEWFDSVSCLFTFSRGALAEREDEVIEFRHTLVRLMSLCHASALEEIKEGSADEVQVLDINGLDQRTLMYLDQCKLCFEFNRVEVLLHMIQVLMTNAHEKGVLSVAPPILSRVYQTLSRGLVNLLNVMKIKHTRFPFPWAQLISLSILVLTIWTPFLVTAVVKSYWLACFMAFVPVFGMVSLNMVAIELERPFGNDMNDLPLDHFQRHMNNGLLMLLHEMSDIVAHTSPQCKRSMYALMGDAMKVISPEDIHEFRDSMLASTFVTPDPDGPPAHRRPVPQFVVAPEAVSSVVASLGVARPSVQSMLSAARFNSLESAESTRWPEGPPDSEPDTEPDNDVAPEEEGAPPSPPASRRSLALLQGAGGSGGAEDAAIAQPARPSRDARRQLVAVPENTAVDAEVVASLPRKGPVIHDGQGAPVDLGSVRIQGPTTYLGS